MSQDLDERIERYLEGALSAEETDAFERELVQPEVAEAFSQALMLRELMASAPPDSMPAGLLERIETAMDLDGSIAQEAKPRQRRLPKARAVLQAMGWTYRGPALAVSGMTQGVNRETTSGLGTLRYALGPLNRPAREKVPEEKTPKRPLWKRLLRRGK